jgi:XapX domain-containing protein
MRLKIMSETVTGILLGLVIGAACRWFDIPLPAPPKLVGALLVVAMTAGFVGAGLILN